MVHSTPDKASHQHLQQTNEGTMTALRGNLTIMRRAITCLVVFYVSLYGLQHTLDQQNLKKEIEKKEADIGKLNSDADDSKNDIKKLEKEHDDIKKNAETKYNTLETKYNASEKESSKYYRGKSARYSEGFKILDYLEYQSWLVLNE